jgi:hypothetical protein
MPYVSAATEARTNSSLTRSNWRSPVTVSFRCLTKHPAKPTRHPDCPLDCTNLCTRQTETRRRFRWRQNRWKN